MSTRNVAEPTVPRWQEITGLSPDLEPYTSRDERETAIRTLVEEVQRLATADFARKTPQGERTYLYDPIHFICNTLASHESNSPATRRNSQACPPTK